MIVAYVSGHGFGHATRVGEVLRSLRVREPRLPITVVTSVPAFLFEDALPGVAIRALECDVGLVQRDALVIDQGATLARWRAFRAGWEERVATEVEWLRRSGACLVLGDIPPLAFEAASRAEVPSVALANFSWDWIYRHMARREPGFTAAAAWAADSYGKTGCLLRLPFSGDLSAFPKVKDVPLVARRPQVSRGEARGRLGLGNGPQVLLSFGGLGLAGLPFEALGRLSGFGFLLTDQEQPGGSRNVTAIRTGRLAAAGLGYADLVGAVDVVVTKPGYGIVSDAIGAGTRLVYTERGDFPEYEVLVREMARHLPCAHVTNEDLRAGRLGPALETVLALKVPAPPDLAGADAAARRLLEAIR